MAQSFYGTSISITNGARTLIYNSPALTTSVLHSIYASNTNNIDLWVDIQIERGTNPGVFTYVGRYIPIPVGGVLVYDKPINFMPNDSLFITSSFSGGTVDVTISTLKIT